jgi:transcriptional regulator with XRE-family HTH domain
MDDPLDSSRPPSRAARDALAKRFGLPNEEWMQDWEYQVADAARIDEFLAYAETDPDDDEAFSLMMMIFQSFEDLGEAALHDPRWERVVRLLQRRFELHRSTLRYWANLSEPPEGDWQITPLVRSVIDARSGERRAAPRV